MVYDARVQHSDAAKRYGVMDLCISRVGFTVSQL